MDAWFFIGDTIYGDDPRVVHRRRAVAKQDYYGKYKANRSDRRAAAADGGDRNVRACGTTTSRGTTSSGTVPAFATRSRTATTPSASTGPMREDGGDSHALYRSFKFGTLAEFFIIDLRS